VGSYLQENNISRCLLVGTKFTMSEPFYTNYISSGYGIEIIAPDENNQDIIHNFIFRELVNGVISDEAVLFFSNLISKSDAEAVLLACTELRLVVNKIAISKTIIDTTTVHANAAIQHILTK
jgi:aspartate racemase